MVSLPASGGRLGPYRLEGVLGEGAAGVVYLARREPGEQRVALKVLRPELAADAVYVRRFEREAGVAAAVRHRHLVPVLEAGEAGGHRFLATEYVGGDSLARRLERTGPLPLDDVLAVVSHVAAGLDALHAAGLVHRDVKPANILIDAQGSAALTDFGLAKGPAHTVLTRAGQALGTIDYMAPEIVRGSDATPATDLYALGCVAYECVAGEAPFAGRGLLEVASAHLAEPPADPATLRGDLPRDLGWALLTALAKEPSDRPRTATSYGHMLRLASRA